MPDGTDREQAHQWREGDWDGRGERGHITRGKDHVATGRRRAGHTGERTTGRNSTPGHGFPTVCWPLETSILLDAQHPGAFRAAIPGMKPITGEPGLFWAPGDWHGEITAVRRGNAWLVVAGGSGLHQRLEVLRHLTASVRL